MYIAIDIGGTNTRVYGFENLEIDSEVFIEKFPTDNDYSIGYENIVKTIKSSKGNIDSIIISHVGPVIDNMAIDPANLITYSKKPIVADLSKEFSCKVYIVNDSICAGFSEYVYGEYKGTKKLAYMTVSTGLGAVIIKDLGTDLQIQMADVGHTIVNGDRRECTCGQIDCIETYTSGKSFSKRFLKNAEDIDDLRIWEESVDYLAISATNLITMFKPEVLIFGGGMIENNEYVRTKLVNEIKSQYRGEFLPKIDISKFGDNVGVYGALGLLKLKPKSLFSN